MYSAPQAMFTVTKLGLEPRLSGPAASGLALIWAHREAARAGVGAASAPGVGCSASFLTRRESGE